MTLITVIVSSLSTLAAPVLIGRAIDTYILTKDYNQLLYFSAALFAIFVIGSLATYV